MMDAVYCQKHHNTIGVATCKLCVIEELKQQRDELLIRCAIAEKDLAALRKRIDDAPVVVVNVGASYVLDRPGVYRLISKEDLLK